MEGLFQKYLIHKADGSDVDPAADYFVLRLDTDPHARAAAMAYALSIAEVNSQLSKDILAKLQVYRDTNLVEREFNIWREGFVVTGDSGEAAMIGTAKGKTFREACDEFFNRDGQHPDLKKYYNSDRLTYWGCRLYDNEMQARKSFG